MKIALDIHGVIDACPRFFSELSYALIKAGWEVHVLTGPHLEEHKIKKKLSDWQIHYTHLFSISDHQKANGENIKYDKNGNPWISTELWDRTKGDYCAEHNIDFCLDDCDSYLPYFTTPVARFYSKGEQKWSKIYPD